jgi:hypothetical protein
MSPGRLFVVVSTGQNVANLPPLLEHGAAGDRVVWVESAEARQRGWSQGAQAVLARLGFQTLPDIEVAELDDFGDLVDKSQAAVAAAREQGLRPHLILNGGPKLTPLGLLRAWQEMNPVLLYGEERPAVCKTYPASLDQPPAVRRYDRHTLDLPEILEVSGHQLFDDQGSRFWPGPLADDLAREPYGADEAYTARLHSQWDRCGWSSSPSDQPPRYTDLPGLVAERLLKWKRSLPPLERIARRDLTADRLFSIVYHATLNLARDAGIARNRAGLPALTPLGPAFERAVARRVHAWLEAGRHPAVHAAWRGVKIARRRDPQEVRAEFDVLLVLKNGVLWHLECKSFTADLKDLDARLFNLQQAGSQLARMVPCGPLLTGYVEEPWFRAQHELRVRTEERRHLGFIPFTLPGQPDRYDIREAGVVRILACPTLEDALAGALAAYRPASS